MSTLDHLSNLSNPRNLIIGKCPLSITQDYIVVIYCIDKIPLRLFFIRISACDTLEYSLNKTLLAVLRGLEPRLLM